MWSKAPSALTLGGAGAQGHPCSAQFLGPKLRGDVLPIFALLGFWPLGSGAAELGGPSVAVTCQPQGQGALGGACGSRHRVPGTEEVQPRDPRVLSRDSGTQNGSPGAGPPLLWVLCQGTVCWVRLKLALHQGWDGQHQGSSVWGQCQGPAAGESTSCINGLQGGSSCQRVALGGDMRGAHGRVGAGAESTGC